MTEGQKTMIHLLGEVVRLGSIRVFASPHMPDDCIMVSEAMYIFISEEVKPKEEQKP